MLTREIRKIIFLKSLIIFIIIFIGCSKKEIRKQQGILDNPAHHTMRGKDLISKLNWNLAEKQFKLALELQPDYAPALSGMSIVNAHQFTLPGRTDKRKNQLRKNSLEFIKKSISEAKSSEIVIVKIDAIKVYTLIKDPKWLKNCESFFSDVIDEIEEYPEYRKYLSDLYFFMGEAYLNAKLFNKASDYYLEVIEYNRAFAAEANKRLKILQKIIRAQPGSSYANSIALSDEITRADLSALLIKEFELEILYKRTNDLKTNKVEFKPPNDNSNHKQISLANDIKNHPLREDILLILNLNVRGLESNPQNLFFPNERVTKAEYCLMLEDILINITKDNTISTKFIGEISPWNDVRSDAYFFNAAKTLTTRGIIEIKNQITSEFGPNDPIHGADILLSLRLLKDELKSYVKGS